MTKSLKENILKYDRLVPRYTSYPTAPHFKVMNDEGALSKSFDGAS
jgi:hypothetical protein